MSIRMRVIAVSSSALLFACSGDDLVGTADSGAPDSGGEQDAGADVTVGHPLATIVSADVDFGLASCGGMAAGQKTITVKNTGDADLTWSADLDTASFFALLTSSGTVTPGQT